MTILIGGTVREWASFFFRNDRLDDCLLMSAVGVQKSTADVDYLLAPPPHDEALLLCDLSHHSRLKVLLVRVSQHLIQILRIDHQSHALL